MEVSQDPTSAGRDSTHPEAPSANPAVPPPTQVPLVDLDADWVPEPSVSAARNAEPAASSGDEQARSFDAPTEVAAAPAELGNTDAPETGTHAPSMNLHTHAEATHPSATSAGPAPSSDVAASNDRSQAATRPHGAQTPTHGAQTPHIAQPTPAATPTHGAQTPHIAQPTPAATPTHGAQTPHIAQPPIPVATPTHGAQPPHVHKSEPPPLRSRGSLRAGAAPAEVTTQTQLPATDPLDVRPSLGPLRPEALRDVQRTGHPVRDRLLAKASEANRTEAPPRERTLGNSGAPGLSGMDQELERLAGPRQQLLSRPVRLGNAVLSPTATLMLVTVVGLAAIASLFLILVQFAPRNPADNAAIPPHLDSSAAVAPLVSAPSVINLPPPVPPPQRTKEPGPWRIGSAESGQRVIRGTIGTNPFLKAVQEAGMDKNQAYRVYGALKEHKDFDRCRAKDEFVALINRADKRVIAFEYVVSKEEIYQAREDGSGKLVGKPLDLKVNKHRVQGSILMATNGFAAAAKDAGLEAEITSVVNRALSGHTNTSQFRPGDRMRVVAQEVTVLGEFHRYAGIEALEYVPVEGDPIRIYYHAAKRQYYDAKGRAPGEGGWRSPVRGAPITSQFNPQRLHPILKKKMPHNGTDFGAPTGTPIYAASYGKIVKLGNYGPNGNYIALAHDNGYETGYSHLSRFEPGLKVGDQVKRSQVIGYVGTTGRSTGPHLHFSARKNGAYIDPLSLNLDALTVLPSAERAIFNGVKEKYDALLEAVALPPALPPQLVAAAPTPTASDDDMHGEEGDEGGQAAPTPTPAVAAPAVAAVAVTPAQPASPSVATAPHANAVAAPVVPAPPPAAGGAFFLTDKELLQSQSAFDDGEVEE